MHLYAVMQTSYRSYLNPLPWYRDRSRFNKKKIINLLVPANYHLAAILLIVAGINKAIDPYPGEIMGALMEQYIISATCYRVITLLQPWFEIGIGLYAIIGWHAPYTARTMGAVYLFFGGLILYVSEGHFTMPLGCGCFGDGHETPVYLLLLRNTLIALFLFLYRADHKRWTLVRFIQPAHY